MLCQSLVLMARHHLSQGRVAEAKGVLVEVVEPPVEVEAELERLREELEEATNQRLVRDSPQAIRQRIVVTLIFIVPLLALSLVFVPLLELGKGPMTAGNSVVATVVATIVMAGLLRFFRKKLQRFQVNYQCLLVGLMVMTTLCGYRFLVWHFQWPVTQALLGDILLATLALAIIGVFVDKVVGWLVLVQLASFILSLVFNEYLLNITAMANLLSCARSRRWQSRITAWKNRRVGSIASRSITSSRVRSR